MVRGVSPEPAAGRAGEAGADVRARDVAAVTGRGGSSCGGRATTGKPSRTQMRGREGMTTADEPALTHQVEEDQNGLVEDAARSGTGARVAHFTVAERAARGKAARADVRRSSHGSWEPAPGRISPVVLLEEQAKTRVPELAPIRYGRVLVSPFTFYRGAAYLMASDLASGPRSGLHTQLCGDAHLSNFGAFASPDRRLVFSLNDFD